jgi:hypothetical protein
LTRRAPPRRSSATAKERAELGRDEGQDAAADLGRRPLDAGSPLNGALAVMKQGAHTARRRGRRAARDAR